jgi:hypothetical protein
VHDADEPDAVHRRTARPRQRQDALSINVLSHVVGHGWRPTAADAAWAGGPSERERGQAARCASRVARQSPSATSASALMSRFTDCAASLVLVLPVLACLHPVANLSYAAGAASLFEQVDKQILVCLRDGRNFLGRLGTSLALSCAPQAVLKYAAHAKLQHWR